MRDVFVSTVETDDPAAYVRNLLTGETEVFDVSETHDGYIVDVVASGLRQRFSFSED